MPSLIDFFGILVILFVIFGSSIMPGIGAAIGRRIARSRGKGAGQPKPES